MPVHHPAWATQAAIYQVNLRQYTPEGTLAAFEPHLERIAELMGGQGIVWFMPLQPIGQEQRKGSMGSYYSVRDYDAVNPEFGTMDDVRRVVARAHALGLRVIIDWVANHTAWDHAWTREHPEWYLKDAQGRIHSYVYRARPEDPSCEPEYWTDVVGLDWRVPAVWDAMEASMVRWVQTTGIDGFRCDVAALVPIGFWERVRERLDVMTAARGGVFMLAEAHEPIHHRAAFDATYDWDLFDQLKAIGQGQPAGPLLQAWWQRRVAHYRPDDWRMIYTANHDSNSWQGSCRELFGALGPDDERAAFKAVATLALLLPGQPLLYGGQEGHFRKRLAFFEKDPIDWQDRPLHAFFREMLALKAGPLGLPNGSGGSALRWIETGHPQVVAFERPLGGGAAGAGGAGGAGDAGDAGDAADAGGPGPALQVVVNLSAQPQDWAGFSGLEPAWASSPRTTASSAQAWTLAPFERVWRRV